MSLINDALKRTRDASFQSGQSRPMTVDAYRVSNRTESNLSPIGSPLQLYASDMIVVVCCVSAPQPHYRVH